MSIPGYIPYTPGQPVVPKPGILQAPRAGATTGIFDPLHNNVTANSSHYPLMVDALKQFGTFVRRIAYDNLGQPRVVLEWLPKPPSPQSPGQAGFSPYYA